MSNYPYEIPPDKIWRRDNPHQDNLSYESVIETNKVKPPGGSQEGRGSLKIGK
jgi:hypothetical protein